MPRARAAGLGLTLACALPVPVLVTAWAAWSLPAYVPRRGYFVTTFLIIGVVGGLFGALPTWWSEWFFSDSGDPVFWWRDRMGLCRE